MPKISACIVAYCDYDEVCAAVRSVLANTPGDDFALYVVDNASPDGCGPRLAQTDFGDARVQVICLPKNLGFGKGHNSIMDRLTSDVHFILNPDVIIHDDILPQMAQWLLDHPGVVMATPQLYFPDGRIQNLPRRKPTPWLLLARQLYVCGGCRPDPACSAPRACLPAAAVHRHPRLAPRPHAGRRQVQNAVEEHGPVFQKMGHRQGECVNGLLFQQKTLALIETAEVHIVRTCRLFLVISQI